MIKYILLLFTLLFHTIVYSQLNTSNRTVNQKLNFKAGANFNSLTASTLLTLDGSKDLTSSSVTTADLAFIDNLLGLDTAGSGLTVFNDGTDAFSAVTITGTAGETTVSNGDGTAGNPTIGIADNPVLPGTEGVVIPNGTTAQRPVSPSTGELRWNTTDTAAEIYDGTAWTAVGAGGADVNLSNLESPTAINQHLLPDADETRNIGSTSLKWDQIISSSQKVYGVLGLLDDFTSNNNSFELVGNSGSTIDGYSNIYGQVRTANGNRGLIVKSANQTGSTGQVVIKSGNSSGTGATGDVTLSTGTTSGNRGEINFEADQVIHDGTGAIKVASGTTAQRPSSPANGMIRFNSDENKYEGYNSDAADWKSLGGGIGSAQTIAIVQADDDAISFSGNDSVFDGAGAFLSGTITRDTTAGNLLTGNKVYFYDASATPQNDYFGFTKDIPQGWRGRTIAYEFTYRTDAVYQNGDIVWQIKDNTNGDLLIINGLPLDQASNANGNGETIRGLVNIPEDAASLDFGFQVTGTTASFDFFVDKISLDIDDFNYKNVTETLLVKAAGNGATLITGAVTPVDFTEIEDEYGAWDGTTFTAPFNGDFIVTGMINEGASNVYANIYKSTDGGSSYTHFKATSNLSGTTTITPFVVNLDLNAGDKIQIRLNVSTTLSNSTIFHHLTIMGNRLSKHVVVDSGDADTEVYRAERCTGYGTTNTRIPVFQDVIENTADKLFSVENTAANGLSITALQDIEVDITYNAMFSAAIGFGISENSTQLSTGIDTITATDIITYASTAAPNRGQSLSWNGILSAGDVIRPHTNGTSFNTGAVTNKFIIKAKKKDKGTYHLVPVTDQENVFSARIQNNGSASIISQSSNWINSVTYNHTGSVTINYADLGLTAVPSFTLGGDTLTGDGSIYYENESVTSVTIRTADGGAASNKNFDIKIQKQNSDYTPPRAFIGSVVFPQTCYLKDIKSSGTGGGSSISGTQTRTLNTKQGDCSWVTLGNGTTGTDGTANQWTLDAGKYNIECWAPAYKSSNNIAIIYDVTAASSIIYGINEYSAAADAVINTSTVAGQVTISSSNTYELDHYTAAARATNGLGGAASLSTETYATCKITKVK